ncbi:EamA family transporter [Sulfitobacter mediterraneus]|jgi:drug/metabolite transporter (DMT)-like permease|uniref:DMT family transporter n=1 Tax=Sulfitobacter TaxID=60136 RepID=UPI00193205AE|nr:MULTISPECIES: EamA family transporter [Sulfitobacter]MBM1633766.1 EamA family transporter [Sulfitobacter mediterraneus]MBM1641719.1 EamA family transporter [Sulfitobacter mediterraneus]MBM1645630.1 EamA family transporter [Sulfitobacter mediterraneus]MBM1649838.1 EamA family transporter [Sulfitobacter mediterraneus]MBM1653699.1 EamA family transporter [Sulfitobacter mediterraneus]
MSQKASPSDIALWLALAAMWSSSYGVIKLGVETLDPMTLVAGRMVIGAAVILAVLMLRGQRLSTRPRDWTSYLITGMLGSTVPFLLITFGEQTVDSALASILMGVAPVATVLLAALTFADERLTTRVTLGVGLALIGVVTLVGPAALSGLGDDLSGQLAIVGATLCYAAGTIYVKAYVKRPAMEMAAGSMLVGAIVACVIATVWGKGITGVDLSPRSIGAVVYLGLFSTAAANLIYFHLVPRLGATRMSQINFAVPVGGSLIGVGLLGETLAPSQMLALGIISGAVYLVLSAKRQPSVRPAIKA